MIKVTVVWGSAEERLSNKAFIEERDKKLSEMMVSGSMPKDGRPITPNSSPIGITLFNTIESATEWEAFIRALAHTYSKTILSISKEDINV